MPVSFIKSLLISCDHFQTFHCDSVMMSECETAAALDGWGLVVQSDKVRKNNGGDYFMSHISHLINLKHTLDATQEPRMRRSSVLPLEERVISAINQSGFVSQWRGPLGPAVLEVLLRSHVGCICGACAWPNVNIWFVPCRGILKYLLQKVGGKKTGSGTESWRKSLFHGGSSEACWDTREEELRYVGRGPCLY